MRTDDIAILSAGTYTYTADQRITLIYTNYQDAPNFGLRIHSIQSDDAGSYECIINTRPEIVQKFELFVNSGKLLSFWFRVNTRS